ncbi:MAG TPA: transglycosylase domain-containing protein, partial [Egibacteraceae bacterium]|nr:transglycosylase domain-containing protein [Egibacteraceae bacterium]
MTALTRQLTRPFAGAARWLRRRAWPVKLAMAAALLVVLPVAFAAIVYVLPPRAAVALGEPVLRLLSDAPPLPGDLDPVTERSVLLAADGSELATLYDEVNRVRVDLDKVADVVVDAVLASEDSQFYEHPGIDHRAVMRAAVANLRSGDVEQGGSTITQQLVKNVYLDSSRTVRRKLTEAWYALQLERRLTKDEILQRYLNETYFGQGAYGIQAAAELYFNSSAADLHLGQAATLVGLIPSPSRLNPVDNPDQAKDARDRVLERLVATDRVDRAAADQARERDLALDVNPPPPPQEPFFVAYVRHLLLTDERYDEVLGDEPQRRERLVFGGGLTVHTTLQPAFQRQATEAIADLMGDPATSPLATLVSIQPGTGAVRAMAVGPKSWGTCGDGDDDCPNTMVNPAVPGLGGSGRQPGSAFKPFVLAAALQEGVPVGWEERTRDGQAIDGCDDDGDAYRPRNYSEDPGIKDMAEAIRVSNNVYHAKLAGLLGPDRLVETARGLGLVGGQLPEQCSVALGSGSAFPVAMAASYATFASGGEYCQPLVVTRIELGEAAGGGDQEYRASCRERFDADLAAHVNDLLQEPVNAGTATAADLGRPVAGKTGTTDDYKDAWFVGYVPQMVTAAWVGFEQPRRMEDVLGVDLVTGGSLPTALWSAYMADVVDQLDQEAFAQPPSVDPVEVPDFDEQHAPDVVEEYAEDYTFNIEVRRVDDYRDRGTIVDQRPEPGTRVPPGKLVTLLVSNGQGDPPRVPDVVGMRQQRAVSVLEDAEYEVDVQTERVELGPNQRPQVPGGTVVDMAPDGGSRLEPG